MPRRDGTGPAMNGMGFRNMEVPNSPRRLFMGCRCANNYRQFGCRYASTKETLAAEKAILEKRLAEIDEGLKQ